MKRGIRTIRYDEALQLEAYCFEGVAQSFPQHFHDYYVWGYAAQGERLLTCGGKELTLAAGDMVLFNPGDGHGCVQSSEVALHYLALNVPPETLARLAQELTGSEQLPRFAPAVIRDGEAAYYLRSLHALIMNGAQNFAKEEALLLLASLLLERYGAASCPAAAGSGTEVAKVCAYMQENFARRLTLEDICQAAGLSKSSLLRSFTRAKGVTPYRYLQTVRVNRAQKLLESGETPAAAALLTGFADQSHFTNTFTNFIGLTPGSYREMFLKAGREHA